MYNNFCDMVLLFHSISYAAMVDAITVAVAVWRRKKIIHFWLNLCESTNNKKNEN